ncbi:MAG: hypothetical protein KC496_14165, partial [Anaerolineae bacterium]|nr:hypothetical protein [Anaerolineae bacterium]
VERARELLAQLEADGSDFTLKRKKNSDQPVQLGFFDPPEENPAVDVLRNLQVDNLSPLEALTKLYELKRLASAD